MEDADGGLSFDFEGGLETAVPAGGPPQTGAPQQTTVNNSTQAPTTSTAPKTQQARKNYRQTVCRHWLRGLCMKGDACGFLHQYDKARMPVCRFFAKFGECREPDCIYKHTNEDIKECNMCGAEFSFLCAVLFLDLCINSSISHEITQGLLLPIEQNKVWSSRLVQSIGIMLVVF